MMKKILLIFALILGGLTTVQSQQISKHALGLRLSDSNGFWAEASYQAATSSDNRIELNLGAQGENFYNAIKLTGLYEWVFQIDGGLNWYVGPGIGGGIVDYDNDFRRDDTDSFGFVTGTVGIEYNFDFPLLISLDFRPELYFDNYNNDDVNFNLGLSARYQF
ncbi:hypothetical protein ACE939_06475 [Aquimarina sp. W85]|uniref:hypothetical protein n=1 Tax=Aquimarina rhodophyticola TaxID=3342246 RepID=UPI00366F47DB